MDDHVCGEHNKFNKTTSRLICVITACIVIIECDWYISTGKCVYFVAPNLSENTFLTPLKHENDNTISKSLLLLMIIHDNCLLSLIKTHNYNNHLKSSSMLRLHNAFAVTDYGGPGPVSVSPVITRCHLQTHSLTQRCFRQSYLTLIFFWGYFSMIVLNEHLNTCLLLNFNAPINYKIMKCYSWFRLWQYRISNTTQPGIGSCWQSFSALIWAYL